MMQVVDLKVDNLTSPLGIASPFPRFSWRIKSDEKNFYQQAYRIRVWENDLPFWDSGIVESPECVNVSGIPRLNGLCRYRWSVSVRSKDIWSEPAEDRFETGMLNKIWHGLWIAGIHNGDVKQPVNYLRQEFSLDKPVLRARLYSTALGVYDCSLNGSPVGDECFAPGWTDYFFRVQHQTYDVTGLLRKGTNVIGIRLGEGWYCGTIARRRNSGKPSYGEVPVFRGELHVTFTDGTTKIVGSDKSWRCSIGGPVRCSDIYDGEIYDARYEMPGWDTPAFSAGGWSFCLNKNRRISIEGRTAPPVRRTQELAPVAVRDIDPLLWKREPCVPDPRRLTIVDFGQNLVGRIRLKLRLGSGESISIRHGEMLREDGSLFLDNLRSARAAITLIGNGKAFSYEPLFTFFGFRYLQITNFPEDGDPASIRAEVIHTDMERTGFFRCSDELVNQLYANQLWSNRGNYLDVPTDCPQRDERLGWLADAWIFADTASTNFDVAGFFEKYLADVNLSRSGYGEYPQYAPFFAVNHLDAEWFGTDYYKGHSAWADAAIICPWILWVKYRDARPMQQHYENMKQWILFQKANSDRLIRCSCVWRDWLNHDDPTSEELISTAFFAYGTALMAKIADLLGKKEDAEEFRALFEEIREAYRRRFFDSDGLLMEKSQTAALLTLHFDLAPEGNRSRILAQLIRNLKARNFRLSTGFLGTPFLLPVLADAGQSALAEKLLLQKAFPSWLYPVLQGATTIWERWDGYTKEKGILPQPMNSFNHYAYGAVAAFLYEYVGGIRADESSPGFRKFIIEPLPCREITGAETEFHSPCGTIRTRWQRKEEVILFELDVPPNTTARVRLPGQPEKELGSGHYSLSYEAAR